MTIIGAHQISLLLQAVVVVGAPRDAGCLGGGMAGKEGRDVGSGRFMVEDLRGWEEGGVDIIIDSEVGRIEWRMV
jgi:hypothetical protein